MIYVDDHAPPHVHVQRRGGGEVKVTIPGPGELVSVLGVRNLATHEAMRAVRLVEENRKQLLREWRKIHG
ncbi:MAG TPA: DUF4160 domain-containing protein [Longimicrobium sp.]|nr:DUF4160 domain-containing protein [Longimicrobium sp.]